MVLMWEEPSDFHVDILLPCMIALSHEIDEGARECY
jgi:hypothetical protein